MAELDGMAKAQGISANALKNAKSDLRNDKKIRTWSTGFSPKTYYISLIATEKVNEYDKN